MRSKYQARDHAPRVLADKHIPGLKAAFTEALRHARALVPVKHVAALLRQGRRAAAVDAIDWTHLREVFKAVLGEVASIVEAGGKLGADQIDAAFQRKGVKVRFGRFRRHHYRGPRRGRLVRKEVPNKFGDRFNFDRFNENTRDTIRQLQDELIAELESGARDSIDQAIMYGVTQGFTPDEIAASIRDSISLTARQSQAVANFRNLIEQGDPGALTRALRDTSFDDLLEDSTFGDGVLSDDIIDKMVDAYAENYLDYRALTIAKTEATRASSLGLHEAYRQAVEGGALPDEAVRRHWQIDLDENTCPVCLSIPEMNPQGVGVNEMFESIDGPQDDSPVHVSCRCSVDYETNLDLVPKEDESE